VSPIPYVLLWAVLLAVLGTVAVLFFDASDPESPALLGGAAAAAAALGFWLAARRRALPADLSVEVDTSPATVWLAISLALLAVGAVVGFWLVLIGAGMCGVGVGGLLREWRAEREAGR
jgi:hypothetical protein